MWGRQIMPLLRHYEVTSNKDAFELAERFTHNNVYYSGAFHEDGSFNISLPFSMDIPCKNG